jgi:surface protein
MNSMFRSSVFNQPLNSWNVVNVTNMGGMFEGDAAFNQDISSWNTSNVINMDYMFFLATSFNCGQAYGVPHSLMQRTASTGWRVGNVNSMGQMFANASAFNGDISAWCETLITTTPGEFATGANASWTTDRQPTWGACPYPN